MIWSFGTGVEYKRKRIVCNPSQWYVGRGCYSAFCVLGSRKAVWMNKLILR